MIIDHKKLDPCSSECTYKYTVTCDIFNIAIAIMNFNITDRGAC